MKLNLVVLTPGNSHGKKLAVNRTPFLIGRDPKCHLRPSSAMVSGQHCTIQVKQGKVFVTDAGSTNGTFVNEVRVEKEVELHHGDRLGVGPLAFGISLESTTTPVDRPTPLPPSRSKVEVVDDDAVAAVLLSAQDDVAPPPSGGTLHDEKIPTGTTEIQALPPDATAEMKAPPEGKPEGEKPAPAKAAVGNTSAAAEELLNKYLRRPRKV
jgi:pSer/pThr/pTyr-binding forkhead associated (FHA) protein